MGFAISFFLLIKDIIKSGLSKVFHNKLNIATAAQTQTLFLLNLS
jgi:hypothetical protein